MALCLLGLFSLRLSHPLPTRLFVCIFNNLMSLHQFIKYFRSYFQLSGAIKTVQFGFNNNKGVNNFATKRDKSNKEVVFKIYFQSFCCSKSQLYTNEEWHKYSPFFFLSYFKHHEQIQKARHYNLLIYIQQQLTPADLPAAQFKQKQNGNENIFFCISAAFFQFSLARLLLCLLKQQESRK